MEKKIALVNSVRTEELDVANRRQDVQYHM